MKQDTQNTIFSLFLMICIFGAIVGSYMLGETTARLQCGIEQLEQEIRDVRSNGN